MRLLVRTNGCQTGTRQTTQHRKLTLSWAPPESDASLRMQVSGSTAANIRAAAEHAAARVEALPLHLQPGAQAWRDLSTAWRDLSTELAEVHAMKAQKI